MMKYFKLQRGFYSGTTVLMSRCCERRATQKIYMRLVPSFTPAVPSFTPAWRCKYCGTTTVFATHSAKLTTTVKRC